MDMKRQEQDLMLPPKCKYLGSQVFFKGVRCVWCSEIQADSNLEKVTAESEYRDGLITKAECAERVKKAAETVIDLRPDNGRIDDGSLLFYCKAPYDVKRQVKCGEYCDTL